MKIREELIDFVKWLNKNSITAQYEELQPGIVDLYLKSINSVPEDKAPALVPNEGKEKELKCPNCGLETDRIIVLGSFEFCKECVPF